MYTYIRLSRKKKISAQHQYQNKAINQDENKNASYVIISIKQKCSEDVSIKAQILGTFLMLECLSTKKKLF